MTTPMTGRTKSFIKWKKILNFGWCVFPDVHLIMVDDTLDDTPE